MDTITIIIYFDNFFTGIDLLLNLLRNGTYACDTVRQDQKGYPSSLKPFIKKGLPARGDYKMTQNGTLSMVLWQDNKPYLLHLPTLTLV